MRLAMALPTTGGVRKGLNPKTPARRSKAGSHAQRADLTSVIRSFRNTLMSEQSTCFFRTPGKVKVCGSHSHALLKGKSCSDLVCCTCSPILQPVTSASYASSTVSFGKQNLGFLVGTRLSDREFRILRKPSDPENESNGDTAL